MKCHSCVGCYRYVGVATERNRDFLSLSKGETDALLKNEERVKVFPEQSGQWSVGNTITLKLDCEEGKLWYKHAQDKWQSKDLDKEQSYHFVFRMCCSATNHFEIVETPDSHL